MAWGIIFLLKAAQDEYSKSDLWPVGDQHIPAFSSLSIYFFH